MMEKYRLDESYEQRDSIYQRSINKLLKELEILGNGAIKLAEEGEKMYGKWNFKYFHKDRWNKVKVAIAKGLPRGKDKPNLTEKEIIEILVRGASTTRFIYPYYVVWLLEGSRYGLSSCDYGWAGRKIIEAIIENRWYKVDGINCILISRRKLPPKLTAFLGD